MNPHQVSAAGAGKPPLPAVAIERRQAAPDTDTATRQTIQMMCEYIRESVKDPEVQRAAAFARRRFAGGSSRPSALVWGVFWYLKHCLKFRQDEASLFRLGERDQQDFLISPAVLVRMRDPAEDCDGFSMMGAALLAVLGVPVYLATVAASARQPWRWSHVFLVARTECGFVPLDASHGRAPGWMVPREDIFRWQAWGLDGRPADVKLSEGRLSGYVRKGPGRGMGDVCAVGSVDPSSGDTIAYCPPSSGFDWGFMNNLVSTAGRVASIAETPTTTISYPGGPTISTPATSGGAAFSPFGSIFGTGNILPWLIVGGIVLFAVSRSGK